MKKRKAPQKAVEGRLVRVGRPPVLGVCAACCGGMSPRCLPMVLMVMVCLLATLQETKAAAAAARRQDTTDEETRQKEAADTACASGSMYPYQALRDVFLNRVDDPRVCLQPHLRDIIVGQGCHYSATGDKWITDLCSMNVRGARPGTSRPSSSSQNAVGSSSPDRDAQQSHESMSSLKRIPRNSRQTRNRGRAQQSSRFSDKRIKKINRLVTRSMCKLRKVMVALPKEPHQHIEPCMVEVRRCQGCTSSELMECHPTKVKTRDFPTLQFVSYAQKRSGNLHLPEDEKQLFVKKSVEEHRACAIRCKVQADNCTELQEYDKDNCKCNCKRVPPQPCLYNKEYIQEHCECRCKRVSDCSTGSNFDQATCNCVKS